MLAGVQGAGRWASRSPDFRMAPNRASQAKRHTHNSRRPLTTSSFRGVTWSPRANGQGLWRARIRVNGRDLPCGYFETELLAARAHDVNALYWVGEGAVLNFSPQGGLNPTRKEARARPLDPRPAPLHGPPPPPTVTSIRYSTRRVGPSPAPPPWADPEVAVSPGLSGPPFVLPPAPPSAAALPDLTPFAVPLTRPARVTHPDRLNARWAPLNGQAGNGPANGQPNGHVVQLPRPVLLRGEVVRARVASPAASAPVPAAVPMPVAVASAVGERVVRRSLLTDVGAAMGDYTRLTPSWAGSGIRPTPSAHCILTQAGPTTALPAVSLSPPSVTEEGRGVSAVALPRVLAPPLQRCARCGRLVAHIHQAAAH